MSQIWFTADTHFNHINIIRYCNRPFDNVIEMNKTLIENWNSRVSEKDLVYHLGDFGFKFQYLQGIIDSLNGKKILIPGSHDHRLEKYVTGITFVSPLFILKGVSSVPDIILCHYAMRTWPRSHWGTWHLFGHSHGKLQGFGKSFDVGVDANQFMPISLYDVSKRMENIKNSDEVRRGCND
jgi:calcineurin-like phosphoesterase family protein